MIYKKINNSGRKTSTNIYKHIFNGLNKNQKDLNECDKGFHLHFSLAYWLISLMICLLKETFTLFKILIIQLTEHESNLQYLKHGGFSMLHSKYIANLEKDLFYHLLNIATL